MNKNIRPVVSLLIILLTFLSTVLCKIETRKMGYTVVRSYDQYQSLVDRQRLQKMEYAKQSGSGPGELVAHQSFILQNVKTQ